MATHKATWEPHEKHGNLSAHPCGIRGLAGEGADPMIYSVR